MPDLTGPSQPANSGLPADSVVIMLHGVGANGDDLMGLAPLFADAFPNMAFHSPNAPHPYAKAPAGYQWYNISNDLSKTDELYEVAEPVNVYIDQVLDQHKLDPSRCVLWGFSQGTIVALHVALRRAVPLAGVLGYSGLLVAGEQLRNEIASKVSVCLIHGADDTLLPHQLTEQASALLDELGVPNKSHVLPGLGHSIDQRGIQIGTAFLQVVLPSS